MSCRAAALCADEAAASQLRKLPAEIWQSTATATAEGLGSSSGQQLSLPRVVVSPVVWAAE